MVTLAEARKAKKLSQRELAKELGLAYSSVSMYECGLRDPSTDNFRKMARLLEVPMEQLVMKSK